VASAPTYATYVANGGRIAEGLFLAALPRASSLVNSAIWPNAVTPATQTAYERAVCAVVDLVDSPPVTREGVGRVTLEYAAPLTTGGAIAHHLVGTGLLYRGI